MNNVFVMNNNVGNYFLCDPVTGYGWLITTCCHVQDLTGYNYEEVGRGTSCEVTDVQKKIRKGRLKIIVPAELITNDQGMEAIKYDKRFTKDNTRPVS